MSEELVRVDSEIVEIEGIKITRGQVDLIKRNVFIGATDDELRLFFYECARRGTHPMDRLIYPVVRKDKDGNRRVTFQTGIDYLRAASEETARYVGQKSVQYGPNIKQKIEGGEIEAPEWAEVTVLRKDPETGEINEIPFKAFWKEFYPGEKLGHMWRKMPNLMLAKCAEAGALRKGFPRKLGGLYINEEMEQAEAVPFGSSRPELKEPQKKNGTVTEKGEKSEVQRIKTVVLKVEPKEKESEVVNKEGKKEKKISKWFIIHTEGNVAYRTFSESFKTIAEEGQGKMIFVEIDYTVSKYGNEIQAIKIIPDEVDKG